VKHSGEGGQSRKTVVCGFDLSEAEASILVRESQTVERCWVDPMLEEVVCAPVLLQRSVEPTATNGVPLASNSIATESGTTDKGLHQLELGTDQDGGGVLLEEDVQQLLGPIGQASMQATLAATVDDGAPALGVPTCWLPR
jgi:hypothetical protein